MSRTQYSVLTAQHVVSLKCRCPLFPLAASRAVFALFAMVAVGCRPTVTDHSIPTAGLPPDAVRLTVSDGKALEELIANHKGEVVLVDYWATWCLPCVQNFPHTVELAKKYRDQGLATIAVSFDRLDDEPKVREFLAEKGADFENVISSHDAVGQKTFEDFGVGPLPEYRLYDREGKLSQKWEGQAEEIGQLAAKIEELLAQKP